MQEFSCNRLQMKMSREWESEIYEHVSLFHYEISGQTHYSRGFMLVEIHDS